MRAFILSTVLAALPLAATANPIEDAIKARQGYFNLLGAGMGQLVPMAKGAIDYDADKAQAHADNLAALMAYNPGFLWVEGSSKADMPGKTRALPVIWENMAGFGEKAKGLGEAVTALQAAAGQGQGELGKAIGAVGGACKACHDDFRAKDF